MPMPYVPADEATLSTERARLVRLCYRLTGSLDAAEDLAQETLYEAVRNAHKLHDGSGYARWLGSIARNVCLRWTSTRGRDAQRFLTPDQDWDVPADDYDLDVELERHELVELLDRALALLPPESREVLVERYVRESPHAEIAERLGLTEAGVAKRLERGRLRLKRVLSTDLLHESASHGLAEKLYDDWQETDIWCPVCGKRRLLGLWTLGGSRWLICKPCLDLPVSLYSNGGSAGLFRGVRGYRAAEFRMLEDHWRRFAHGIAGRTAPCPSCGSLIPYRIGLDPLDPGHFACVECERCGVRWQFKVDCQLLATPEGRRFWHEHPRIRRLPEREVEAGGVPAIVAGYESMTGQATIEGIFARDTFERIAVHATPGS
jgi:RNA polymerase sigma-70 factor (ECF subfamily)